MTKKKLLVKADKDISVDLTRKSDEELEDILLDLCGRLELDDWEVDLLRAVEEERERRSQA